MAFSADEGALDIFSLAFSLPDEPLTFDEQVHLQPAFSPETTTTPSQPSIALPVEILSQGNSVLQAVVRFLHDAHHLSFSAIARQLSRDPRTIWSSYHQSQPLPVPLPSLSVFSIPIRLFQDRRYSMLEHVVHYLDGQDIKLTPLARMLGKDPRTIWTIQHRIAKKQAHATA